jgi:predicted Zn-dependent protease
VKELFNEISAEIFNSLKEGEEAVTNIDGEDSTYVRYNGGKVRQNTQVHQYRMSLLYKKQNKTFSAHWSLENNKEKALKTALEKLAWLRKECHEFPDSPHLPKIENNGRSDRDFKGRLPTPEETVKDVTGLVKGHDFCGLVASGSQTYSTENSKGQSHWFTRESFFVDYSMYKGDRAVKGMYSDAEWSPEILKAKIIRTASQLALMNKPVVKVKPGKYKVYLAPGAVNELTDFLCWNAFSLRAVKTGSSCFTELDSDTSDRKFSPQFTIRENFKLGLTAPFNELGEVSPELVPLIEKGRHKNWLISTKSALEFNVPGNQATEGENPRNLEILPGGLKETDILKELGTGLYLSNLHYINSSDQKSARVTGMTRYACFWVEKGEIVGPIENLRFDESLYEAWGPKLIGITDFSEIIPNVLTYDQRSMGGHKMPGMLIEDFSFTL